MADELDENYEIGEEFIPRATSVEEVDDDDDDEEVSENDRVESRNLLANATKTNNKRKNRRKNITEILELKKDELVKPSFAVEEFTKILRDYANKKLSGVERNELNLVGDDVVGRLKKMILNRKKTHILDVPSQFKKKLGKKLRTRCRRQKITTTNNNNNKETDNRSPFIIVLAQSAVRCIELHKLISSKYPNMFRPVRWLYAFAKHKKLAEQIAFIEAKLKQPDYALDVIYATPQRIKQLFDAGCLSPQSTAYVFFDYSYRDCKLKRIVDQVALRADVCELLFKSLLPLNRDRIKLKFYLA